MSNRIREIAGNEGVDFEKYVYNQIANASDVYKKAAEMLAELAIQNRDLEDRIKFLESHHNHLF